MKEVRITDLDELALKVRDRISRSYILEAIDAYRGGAYRSSIISVWIAVNFDIISKIRELANRGDRMAQDFVHTLDKAIRTKNIKELQRVEENLLDKAETDYEFISNQEKYDLEQLKNDRMWQAKQEEGCFSKDSALCVCHRGKAFLLMDSKGKRAIITSKD